jgi:hypothetical protein
MSLPALFLLTLPEEWRPDVPETEVRLVPVDTEAESRELVVGVLAYVEEVEPRFGVKLIRALTFFGVFS